MSRPGSRTICRSRFGGLGLERFYEATRSSRRIEGRFTLRVRPTKANAPQKAVGGKKGRWGKGEGEIPNVFREYYISFYFNLLTSAEGKTASPLFSLRMKGSRFWIPWDILFFEIAKKKKECGENENNTKKEKRDE